MHFSLSSLSLLPGGANPGGEPESIMAGGREVAGRRAVIPAASAFTGASHCLQQPGHLEKEEGLERSGHNFNVQFKKIQK